MVKKKNSKAAVSPYVVIASLATLVAGILHVTLVASEHKDIALEMIFFISIGLAQILWAVWFYSSKRFKEAYFAGLVLNGAVLVVWLLSRTVEPPFGGDVEEFGQLDIIIALLQVIAIVASAYCVAVLSKPKDRKKQWMLAIIVPVISGMLLFAGGRVTAEVFDIDVSEHGHGAVVEDDHHDDEEEAEADHHDDDDSAHQEEEEAHADEAPHLNE